MKHPLILFAADLLLAAMAVCLINSCAQMGANDGLVPMTSAQSNLPYIPSANVGASPMRASSGMMVSPLADTRRAFWQ